MRAQFQHQQDKLLHHNQHIEGLEDELLRWVEAFQEWYDFRTGHLARRESELAARKNAFIQEKTSW